MTMSNYKIPLDFTIVFLYVTSDRALPKLGNCVITIVLIQKPEILDVQEKPEWLVFLVTLSNSELDFIIVSFHREN